MNDTRRSIFRSAALQCYLQRREPAIVPRFGTPATAISLWALLGLLVAAGAYGALWAQVPVYTSGQAVVVSRDAGGPAHADMLVVAFCPPESLARLQAGQPLLLHLAAGAPPVHGVVGAVEPQILSPAAAQRRFGLGGGAALAVAPPAAVALAHAEPGAAGLPAARYAGVYRVEIVVGTRRIASLLPVIGRWFGA